MVTRALSECSGILHIHTCRELRQRGMATFLHFCFHRVHLFPSWTRCSPTLPRDSRCNEVVKVHATWALQSEIGSII
jgi:hypothetical protein